MLAVSLPLLGDAGAAATTIGALLVGIPSLSAGARRPLAPMALTTAGLALSSFAGSVTAHDAWVHIPLLGLWAFAGGMLVALGDTGSVVGTQATMAFVVLGRFGEAPQAAATLGAYVAAGGAVQILLVLAMRWPTTSRRQRQSVAAAYRRLGSLAAGNPLTSSLPAAAAIDAADAAISSPSSPRSNDTATLQSLLDEARRVRIELSALQALRTQLDRLGGAGQARLAAAADSALGEVAVVLGRIADAVDEPTSLVDSSLGSTLADVSAAGRQPAVPPREGVGHAQNGSLAVASALIQHLDTLAGQLRAVAMSCGEPERGRGRGGPRRSPRSAGALLDRLDVQTREIVANLTTQSAAMRHALRLAVLVPISELLAAHTPLARGYWVPLTVALILRPDFGTTFSRGFARLAGTVVGVGIVGVVVASGRLGGGLTVAILGVLVLGSYVSFRASYTVYSACLTGLVVLLVNLATPGATVTLTTALDRLLDTLIGGAIALAAYAAWPTWTAGEAKRALAELAERERVYLSAVLAAVTGASTLPDAEARLLARQMRLARSNCEATLARAIAEPTARQLEPAMVVGMMAALRRVSLATHVLRTSYGSGPGPVHELQPLSDGLDLALRRIVAALNDAVPEAVPRLREMHSTLVRDVGARPGTELLLVESDELVDAVDTVADLVLRTSHAPP